MIITPLMSHQRNALKYLRGRRKCALFWKMGTGKTLTALAHAEAIKAHRILITSDKNNVVNTWPDEIARHTNWEDIGIRQRIPTEAVSIVNYELLSRCEREYAQGNWDMWIGDESSEFKDQRTDKHKKLAHTVNRIPNKLILNGSPMTERPEDMFGQFKILDGGHSLGSYITHFRNRYLQPDHSGHGWIPRRSSFTDIQRAVHDISHWMMEPTNIKMPERHYVTVHVDLTEQQRELDNQLKEWFEASLKGRSIEVKHAASLFIKRVQLANGIFRDNEGGHEVVWNNKIGVLTKIIDQNKDAKIVVWHNYVPETEFISNHLNECGFPHLTYLGPDDSDILSAFADMDKGILLIRNSMCKGLNQLADADIAVIYSNPFSYRNRVQLEGRTQRISSKTSSTHYVDIVTEGGMDEVVFHMLSSKRDVSTTLAGLRNVLDLHTVA